MNAHKIKLQPKRRFTVILIFLASALFVSKVRSQEVDNSFIDDCYLFVDGEYVQPPYSIEVQQTSISINGKLFGEDYFDLPDFNRNGRGRAGMGERRGPAGRRQNNPSGRNQSGRSPLAKLASQLSQTSRGGISVLYENEKPLLFSSASARYDFLKYVSQEDNAAEVPTDDLVLRSRQILDRLKRDLYPRKEFLTRATVDLEAFDEATYESERAISANQLVAKISYPLTVFAMVAIALAFGHLLTHHPNLETESSNERKNRGDILKLLLFVAVFSVIDLIWTLAASYAGSMRELNPLGSDLIGDPLSLVAFKLIATGVAIGILYALHRQRIAQVGAWWCCLLLTLLTARWVVFQSLFS